MKNYPKSNYSFERTELRVLQAKYPDNEDFLNVLADMIGKLTTERDELKQSLTEAKEQLRSIENSVDLYPM